MHPSLLPQGKRILLIRLSAIGDVLHATSITRNLKRLCPGCRITWLVSPPAAALLAGNGDIDRVLVWDRRPFDEAASHLALRKMLHLLGEARRMMREEAPDIVLDIQCLFLTGLLARLSGAPRRIGIHERHEGNHLFMTEVAPASPSMHKIHRYMTALAPLGIEAQDFRPGTVLTLPVGSREKARSFLQKEGIEKGKPLLLVAIQTTWQDKQLRPEVFADALAPLSGKATIVFIGGKGDAPAIETCRARMAERGAEKTISLAGKTDLLLLAAIMQESDLLLCCDSGPLYIAEAVHLPTLSVWGPTLPTIYGPLTPGHTFLVSKHSCTGCCKTKCPKKTNACMEAFEAGEITEAAKRLLFPEVV